MNLTGIVDEDGISEKHFLDSIMLFKLVCVSQGAKVIDVGTGAGFPGMVMKIYRNDLNVTLLDSLNKRIDFLKNVSYKTVPVNCIHCRAEDAGKNPIYREKFDYAVARAVAALPVLSEYCMPFVKVGGRFIAMKGPSEDINEALKAVEILGGKIENIIEYNLPCGDKRVIAVIKKISPTLPKFPRNSSQIKKRSLG